jgi:hypothetical protein
MNRTGVDNHEEILYYFEINCRHIGTVGKRRTKWVLAGRRAYIPHWYERRNVPLYEFRRHSLANAWGSLHTEYDHHTTIV